MRKKARSLSISCDLFTKRHLPPQTSITSQDTHGSPIVATSQSESGVFWKIEPITEKSKSSDTGHAEILPSGMTEKKSIPEPHRRRDFLPERSEFITPRNGTIPATLAERDISSTQECTSEEIPESYDAIQSSSPASVSSEPFQNIAK